MNDRLPGIVSLSDDMPLDITHELTKGVLEMPNEELSIYSGTIQDQEDMLLSKEYIDDLIQEYDENSKLTELPISDDESEEGFLNDSEQEGVSIDPVVNGGDHEADTPLITWDSTQDTYLDNNVKNTLKSIEDVNNDVQSSTVEDNGEMEPESVNGSPEDVLLPQNNYCFFSNDFFILFKCK